MMPDGRSWSLALAGGGMGEPTLIVFGINGSLPDTFSLDTPFGVDEAVTVNVRICRDADQDCACDRDGPDGFIFVGSISGGWFECPKCSISERVGGAPKCWRMDALLGGSMMGTMFTFQPPSSTEMTTTIAGWLRGLMAVPLPALAVYDEAVEYACEGETESDR